jgi:cytoskeleton protein RodZ
VTESDPMTSDNVPAASPSVAVETMPAAQQDSSGTSASVGELLRQAREKAGLSLGDVASRLRMGVKQVRALEQDDYAALPTGTFLRGFVRNFAKEVGVKTEVALNLLAETHQAAASITASAVVMPAQQNINVAAPGGEFATPRARLLIAIAIGVLLLTVVWWWWEYVRPHRADGGRAKTAVEETAVSTSIAAPLLTAPSVEVAPTQETIPASQLSKQIADNSVSSAPVALSSPTTSVNVPPPTATGEVMAIRPSPVLTAGSGQLGFTFSGESWIEVVDRNGKSLLDRKFKRGDAEEVVGRAPFSVVIGNAQATRMAYNGKEIDLAPHTRASVARLNVK